MRHHRLYAVGPLAATSTIALFWMMQGLIGHDGDISLDTVEPPRIIDYVQAIPPDEPPREKWDVDPPEEAPTPPEFPDPILPGPDGPIGVGPSIPPPPRPTDPDLDRPDFGQSDGDYMPLVVVQAQFPRRAQERGIEGYAVVELTVAPDGTVPPESIVVIESDPQGYFEREALKAAAKFKYKPRVINGVGQTVSGVRYRFSFTLKE